MPEDEILDLVNKEGGVIGQATKAECHSNPELIHRTVHFTLVNKDKGRILFTKRSSNKKHDPGMNVFLGEHILSGESFVDGVIRGVEEELGFRPGEFVELATHIFEYDTQTEYVKFFGVIYGGEDISFDREEIDNVWWIDLEDLKGYHENISDMTQYWIDNVDWNEI